MSEAPQHDMDDKVPGEDLPADGQIAVSIGKLLGQHPDIYLERARMARAEARERFAETYAKLTESDLEKLNQKLEPKQDDSAED
jgi:hypothetical protein